MLMSNPKSFYETQLTYHNKQTELLKKKLNTFSVFRLITFLLLLISTYFAFLGNNIALAFCVLGLFMFFTLLILHNQSKEKYKLQIRLKDINSEELNILSGKYDHRNDGDAYKDSKHVFSLDIDLFGKGSFFQYMNRTTLLQGEKFLTYHLLSNNIKDVTMRQQAVQELSKHTVWRQRFSAIAQGFDVENSTKPMIKWLKDYTPFLNKIHYYSSIVFGLVSLLLFIGVFFGFFHFKYALYFLFIGLAVTGGFLKRINSLALYTTKIKDIFMQYSLLLKEIERLEVKSQLLQEKKMQIQANQKKSSVIFNEFYKALDALDHRNNLLVALFGNGYFLRDIIKSYRVEQWIKNYGEKIEDWFETVNFFDAYNSLATFTFNHPDLCFPEITSNQTTISAQDLGHPLITHQKRVTSDFKISRDSFFIITGANMAGKSTFLRTVALHIVMANCGLPVTAKKSQYHPVKLITSMRTTDSLDQESSYFFSELSRLKFIVEHIENDKTYFIILDEILKGTNSKDKAKGSRQFVEKLIKLKATGIIATHDLSLTTIENEIDEIENYYFDVQIINDELLFDYKLKKGVCKNMNASFLLKKMKIV